MQGPPSDDWGPHSVALLPCGREHHSEKIPQDDAQRHPSCEAAACVAGSCSTSPRALHPLFCLLRRSNVSFAFAASGNTSAAAYQCALQAVSSATGQPASASLTYSACTSPVVRAAALSAASF